MLNQEVSAPGLLACPHWTVTAGTILEGYGRPAAPLPPRGSLPRGWRMFPVQFGSKHAPQGGEGTLGSMRARGSRGHAPTSHARATGRLRRWVVGGQWPPLPTAFNKQGASNAHSPRAQPRVRHSSGQEQPSLAPPPDPAFPVGELWAGPAERELTLGPLRRNRHLSHCLYKRA